MGSKVLLAIETSCDDTSLAIFIDNKLVSLNSATSLNEYQQYGGIIPEIAARSHEDNINKIFNKCVEEAKIKKTDIKYIAYTATPGLPGSLHVGKVFAKTLACLLKATLIPIDHMMGHAFSFAIDNQYSLKYPFISLVISGGNTILYRFDKPDKFKILNKTTDDAVGECLDKIGRLIGLDYPGGISLDKEYQTKKSNMKTIPHLDPWINFSFSGIKSFATNYVSNCKNKKEKIDAASLGSSCLKWCVDDIINKIKYYCSIENIKNVAIGGGVAANVLLYKELCNLNDIDVIVTPKKYCGDNAAMIGFYAIITNKVK
ncbi:MAG: tRNA (adenosine(37)-N6)-threonylcarbamoyltransferase complex transferase subunit TsaD [Mycoplasmoidaceae bacterium]|nr:MAG: tRNA (adenosine(37)-N6)-threonylcarbamoyltransferase complex transferase subunit TsaD [Mycoplasmoidaceae bacterium]